jgi:hypothetical protein
MEPKDAQVEQQVEETMTPEQEAEAFAQGFHGTNPEDSFPAEAQAPAEGEVLETEGEGGSPPEEEPILEEFGMTASQLRQKLAMIDQIQAKYESDIQKVYGKFGEINRHFQQQGPGTLNKLALNKLREEYPDVAELLEADLSQSIGKPGPSPDFQEAMDQRLRESLSAMERNFEARLLAIKHPDYGTLFDGQNQRWLDIDAKEWIETVADEETRQNFLSSYDATWLSNRLDQFKEWKRKKYAAKDSSNKRLERAAVPQTTNARAPGPSVNDEFEAGFKAARQQL